MITPEAARVLSDHLAIGHHANTVSRYPDRDDLVGPLRGYAVTIAMDVVQNGVEVLSTFG
jgi:hypothetical protein